MTTEYSVGLTYADRLNLATQARHNAIKIHFNCELAELTSLMGPMSDGPEWPAGAAWLAARHELNACIISDGLSDPWVERDKPETGLGLEVFRVVAQLMQAGANPLLTTQDDFSALDLAASRACLQLLRQTVKT